MYLLILSMNWIESVIPKSLDDIEIYKNEIEIMENWIKDYKNKVPSCKKVLLIMGNIGTGKTLLAELLFKKYLYDKIELNSTDFRSQKKLSDFLRKTLCFKNVMDLFCGETKPIGLLMDEIDTMNNDKGGLGEFIQILKEDEKCAKDLNNNKKIKDYINLYNPIVCTCLDIYDKKINDLKKYCQVVTLKKLNIKDITSLINKIYKDVKFEKKIIQELFTFADGDIRKLLSALDNLKDITLKNNKITLKNMTNLNSIFEKKNNDVQLLEAAHNIFFKKVSFYESILYYHLEPYFLPYMIYHNLDNFIANTNLDILNKIKLYKNVLNSICQFDIHQNFLFETNDWCELNEFLAFHGVYNINYLINFEDYKKKDINIEFTNIMNKMSQSLVNKKLINCAKYSFKKTYVEINEIIYLSVIFIDSFLDFKNIYNVKDEVKTPKKNTKKKKDIIKIETVNDDSEVIESEESNTNITNNTDTNINTNNKINHDLLVFMNKNKMTIDDLENILKLEKFNNDDVKIKKNLNVNLIKKIEDNLFY